MPIADRIWHALFSRWYDCDHAGQHRRAGIYGRLADWWCSTAWPDGAWVRINRD